MNLFHTNLVLLLLVLSLLMDGIKTLRASESNYWISVERALPSAGLDNKAFRANPLFQSIVSNRNEKLINEMLSVQGRPVIVLAAFFAIAELDRDSAYGAALRILSSTDRSAMLLYAPIYTYLTNEVRFDVFKASFTSSMEELPFREESFLLIVNLVPKKLLEQWFNEVQGRAVVTSKEALVLTRLCNDAEQHKAPLSKKMKATLESYSAVPGLPRLAYLHYGDSNSVQYEAAVTAVIADEGVDPNELIPTISRRVQIFKKVLASKEMEIAPKRRGAFLKIIERYGK